MLVGTIGILVLLILVAIGTPVAVALFAVSLTGTIYVEGLDKAISIVGSVLLNCITNYPYAVIPGFLLMGHLGHHSGLFTQIFEVARKWFGRLPGGLAMSVVIGDSIFAACSGSSIAACIVIGKSSLPVLRKSGYPDTLATGAIAAGGTLAALIPPSILICIYGLLVDESIGKLLIAGIIPGAISAAIYMIFLFFRSWNIARAEEKTGWKEKLYSVRYLWVVGVVIIAILGGIYFGICTPSEAGALGAVTVFLLALFTRTLTTRLLWTSLRETVVTTGMILIIIVAAILFGRFLVGCGFSKSFITWISALQLSPVGVFAVITIVYFMLGCFIGAVGMMTITLPVFYPMMMTLGFDPIWFGIIVVKYCEMAFITPPVGVNLFAVQSIDENIRIETIMRGAAQFLAMDLLTIAIFYVFPEIVTFLPYMM